MGKPYRSRESDATRWGRGTGPSLGDHGGSPHVWTSPGGYAYSRSGSKWRPDMILLLALLIILIVAGAGFALHLLWWVAIAALVVWALSFLLRR
jgi:Flp pilus assembly protein TadB